MKISVLLPYKENFSPFYAGAVSLFVKDTCLNSRYKKNIIIYGSTNHKQRFLLNYKNIIIKKKIFTSSSKTYVDKFLKYEEKINSQLIEIHNRPNYIHFLKNKTKSKIILYFHNDPIYMSGSKKVNERIELLKIVNKIIFNSEWTKNRFLKDIYDLRYNHKLSIIHQSSSKTKINFNKKKKIISFVGKLNTSKGYDIFGETIIKILNKYNNWKAIVVGDEQREKLFFKHKNLKIYGFKKNSFILNKLKEVSISVVCSRWQEPFGRASLEASSRGCAIILTNRGGLLETTKHPIILNNLSVNELYNKINYLIVNPKILLDIQKKNYKNFRFDHKLISNMLDNLRNEFISLYNFNIIKPKIKKILHITNFNERFDGRLHYNTGKRLNNGFIRNEHNVLTISDRDIVSNHKSIKDFSGRKTLNNKICESINNFKPDIIILGHADNVEKKTLEYAKDNNKNIKISQWFLDPLIRDGPDYKKNKERILKHSDIIDDTFVTTYPKALDFVMKNAHFLPNPCDSSFETLENYRNNCNYDIFFAMSHGVHRGRLKKGKIDGREIFLDKLINITPDVKFDLYGINNKEPIWSNKFLKQISNSSMGLNLSRGKPIKYYSSDRIVQLMGNGLLTFIDKKYDFQDFFTDNEIITYKNINDLSEKIKKYKRDKKIMQKKAKNGKIAYFRLFNSVIVSDYIISKTFNEKSRYNFIWNKK